MVVVRYDFAIKLFYFSENQNSCDLYLLGIVDKKQVKFVTCILSYNSIRCFSLLKYNNNFTDNKCFKLQD